MKISELEQPEIDALISIKDKNKIEDKRFWNGVYFTELLLQGERRTEAYQTAFGGTSYDAKINATRLYSRKWIQEIKAFLEVDQSIDDLEDHVMLKEEMRNIIEDSTEHTDKISAAKVLKDLIDTPAKKKEREAQEGTTFNIALIVDKFSQAASQGKMLDRNGEIIDVSVID